MDQYAHLPPDPPAQKGSNPHTFVAFSSFRAAELVTEFPMKGVFMITAGMVQLPKEANQSVIRPPESNLVTSALPVS